MPLSGRNSGTWSPSFPLCQIEIPLNRFPDDKKLYSSCAALVLVTVLMYHVCNSVPVLMCSESVVVLLFINSHSQDNV